MLSGTTQGPCRELLEVPLGLSFWAGLEMVQRTYIQMGQLAPRITFSQHHPAHRDVSKTSRHRHLGTFYLHNLVSYSTYLQEPPPVTTIQNLHTIHLLSHVSGYTSYAIRTHTSSQSNHSALPILQAWKQKPLSQWQRRTLLYCSLEEEK